MYEGAPDAGAVKRLTLTEKRRRTTVTIVTEHTCREHRDMHLRSGMEAGMQGALDLLEGVVLELRASADE